MFFFDIKILLFKFLETYFCVFHCIIDERKKSILRVLYFEITHSRIVKKNRKTKISRLRP